MASDNLSSRIIELYQHIEDIRLRSLNDQAHLGEILSDTLDELIQP